MLRFDGEAPHVAGLQLEIDVVLLGAERRFAAVDRFDRERVLRPRRMESGEDHDDAARTAFSMVSPIVRR